MPSIDERVVAMSFENAKFEAGVAQTMATLTKLNAALAKMGSDSGFQNIEKAANKVTLEQPMSALDKLRARLGGAGQGAAEGFNEIEKAGSKVTLEQPMSALDKLRARLGTSGQGAAEGFSEIERASSRVSLQGLNSALDSVTAKFSVLQGAASVAFGNITSQATMKGGSFLKGFTIGPILQGLNEYQTNLKAIQTVQANTDQPLTKINKSLQELNHYSDLTIYNFGEMAKNIGTFTAAGVDLKTATSSIKGIANLAALSGSSSQQASVAMYQLSQAIASGKVGLQDWNSVVNAGMGGKKLQTALATTAVAMGKIGDNSVKTVGPLKKLTINGQSFRESIMAAPGKEPWLTSDILVNTLATLDGRFSRMALSQEKTKDGLVKYTKAQVEAKIADSRAALEKKNGVKYTDEQFKALMKLSDSAFKSATEVKTLGQVFDVAKEAIGSGWSQSFQSIFGNLKEAKTLFTGMSNAINGFIGANALARNTVLHDWKKLGGRTALIDGIKTAFKDLGAILKPIGQAFRDIFPRKTGKDLADLTKRFADLMHNLKPSAEVVDGIRRTFRGFFAVLSIGWYIVKKVIGVFGDLLGVVGGGAGGFMNFTGGIGDFLTALQKAIVKGDALAGFFKGLSNVLRVPLELIKSIGGAFSGLFAGVDTAKASQVGKTVTDLSDKLGPLENILHKIGDVGKKIINTVNKIFEPFSKTISGIGHAITNFGENVADAFVHGNFDHVFAAVNTALVGGIFLAIKKALGQPINFIGGVSGTLKTLSGVLGGLTTNLKTMQSTIKAVTLAAIAAAILALAAGVAILSSIDPKKLQNAMGAVAVGLGELIAALSLLDKATKGASFATLPLIAASMVALAVAVTILAAAVKLFSTMSPDELSRGLMGVGGALTAVGLAMKLIGPSITLSAPGILAVAVAMNVLGVAMKIFGSMKWDEIARGLVGVGGSLLAIGIGVDAIGPSILLIGPGLIAAAAGLVLLSGAVMSFGSMDLGSLVKGIIGIGGALVVLGLSMEAIPPTIALQAAGLIVAAVALTGLAGAIKAFGSMDVGTLIKGIVAMAGALLVLAVGLTAMVATLPGSVALLAAAAAFAVLTPVLGILGSLSWGTILKGLGAMAAVLAVLGLVGGVAAAGLIALGVGLAAVGVGVTVIGAGIYLIVKALILLGDASIKSTGVLIAAITAFIVAIPKMVIEFVKGLLVIIDQMSQIAPKIVDALAKILIALLDVIIKASPKLQEAMNRLLGVLVAVIMKNTVPLMNAGIHLIQSFLTGVSQNIGSITTKVGLIIARFLGALADRMPGIIAAGARLIRNFLFGVAKHVPGVVAAGARVVVKFLQGVAQQLPKMIGAALQVIASFLKGLGDNLWRIRKAALHLARKFLNNVVKALLAITDIAAGAVIRFVNGIADEIHKRAPQLRHAFLHLAYEMADAFSFGLLGKAKHILKAFQDVLAGDEDPEDVRRQNAQIQKTARKFDRAYARRHHGRLPYGGRGSADANWPANRKVAATSDMPDPEAPVKGGVAAVRKFATAVDSISDVQPTITPVLDLTAVEEGAKKVSAITAKRPVVATVSFKQAVAISGEKAATEEAQAAALPANVELKFEQNNTSPEALPEREIYRRTRNQLAQARSALQGVGGFAAIST